MPPFNTSWNGNPEVNFQKEITNMLHGFGDNPNPNAATVFMVENIVLGQLRAMIQQAIPTMSTRGNQLIMTNADIIFLMRKNTVKLKRLCDYQKRLDFVNKQVSSSSGETIMPNMGTEDDADLPFKKKRSTREFVLEFDEPNDVAYVGFDAIDYLRKVRAAKISEALSYEKYLAYHKARCASFKTCLSGPSMKNLSKLEMWINPDNELKITQSALEILAFLAYETVAEIVDGVFFIRQDAKRRIGDPFSKLDGGYFCNPMSLSNAVYIKTGFEGVPPITVVEVREVLRRHYCSNIGMNGLYSRNTPHNVKTLFIAI